MPVFTRNSVDSGDTNQTGGVLDNIKTPRSHLIEKHMNDSTEAKNPLVDNTDTQRKEKGVEWRRNTRNLKTVTNFLMKSHGPQPKATA